MASDDMERGAEQPESRLLEAMIDDQYGEPEGPTGAAAIFGPFISAITSPAKCWEALDARPLLSVWIALWVAAFSTAIAIYNLPITQQAMIQVTRAQMRSRGQEISAEQLQRTEQMMTTFSTWIAYVGAPLGTLIFYLAIPALVVWLVASMMRGGATFSRSFALVSAGAVVRPLLQSIYVTIILQLNPPQIRRPEDAIQMQPSLGLDLLLSGVELPLWLTAVLKRVDLFNIWWIALVASGSMVLLKLSKGQGIAVGVIIWILGTMLAVGGALLQGLGS